LLYSFSLFSLGGLPLLHSFPTRRSSDLNWKYQCFILWIQQVHALQIKFICSLGDVEQDVFFIIKLNCLDIFRKFVYSFVLQQKVWNISHHFVTWLLRMVYMHNYISTVIV